MTAALLLAACGRPEIEIPVLVPPEEEPPVDPVEVHHELDPDGDGFTGQEDCAPFDPRRYPGAPERCNGLDDDCDGVSDLDEDGDGYPWCSECADEHPEFHPGADDPPGDDLDQDCDGTDGVGTPLTEPIFGAAWWGVSGWALAAADFDGDGCDDLLVGQPGQFGNYHVADALSLSSGCWPWAWSTVRSGQGNNLGFRVGLRQDRVAAVEYTYWGAGRVLLFDGSFSPTSSPRLEIHGTGSMSTSSVALIGEPAEWVLVGDQGSLPGYGPPAQFGLFDADRTGVIDLQFEAPDLVVTTGDQDPGTGWEVGDVGDRDGDGSVDLALGSPLIANAVYFFPEVTGGHLTDAPEVWHGVGTDEATGDFLSGRSDLDGDGLEDALVSSVLGAGAWELAGRVYLAPWAGSGERWLETDAPARVEGEFTYEWTGNATAAGDLDGDGQDDLVVGAPGNYTLFAFPGRVSVFLGPLEGVLTRDQADRIWVGTLGDYAGFSLATGDFDGSGKADIAIGAPFADADDTEEGEDVGAVYLLIDPL